MVSKFINNDSNQLALFVFVIIAAAMLRFPNLADRPMHSDEAVQATKFGALLEENYYKYDINEHHGPTLYYFALIPAFFTSAENISDISETTLRILPAIFGILLIALFYFLRNGLGWGAVFYAGLIAAFSPGLVFYSRYFIQEILLVFFAMGVIVGGYKYIKTNNLSWCIATGVFLGLMHATKETFIIFIFAMLTAVFMTVLTVMDEKHFEKSLTYFWGKLNPKHLLYGVVSALAVSALFYSSFFANPQGVADSYMTFVNYFDKASGNDLHTHQWYYYFQLLIYSPNPSGVFWSEIYILIFAGIGIYSGFTKKVLVNVGNYDKNLIKFFAFYTVIMVVIFSLIPYKTPWNMLGFLSGFIVLAGCGASYLIEANSERKIMTMILLSGILFGNAHLLWQAHYKNTIYDANQTVSYESSNSFIAAESEFTSNPYVYAHPTNDIFKMISKVKEIAKYHLDGKNVYIEVAVPGHDYWPLPWYLRDYPNIGWWDALDMTIEAGQIIIIAPELEKDLVKKLYEIPPPGQKNMYLPLFEEGMQLRPMVELKGYVIKELWDSYQQR